MAVSARQLTRKTLALINNVGEKVDHPRFAVSVGQSLRDLYGAVSFLTDIADGSDADAVSMPDFVFRPGRALSGNDFKFGTSSSDVGIMYDNTSSSSGSTSTGRIDMVAGTVRVRHGAVANTGRIFEVMDASAASTWFYVDDDGQSYFNTSTTGGVVNIAWSAGGPALAVGTSGSSTVLRLNPQSATMDARFVGTGNINWRHNTAGTALLFKVDGNTELIAPTGTTTTVPLTVTGRTSQSVANVYLVPATSQTGSIIQCRNIGDSATVFSVAPTGATLIDTTGAVVGLQIKSVGGATDSFQLIDDATSTVEARFNQRGHLAIDSSGQAASNAVMAKFRNTSTSGSGISGWSVTLTDTAAVNWGGTADAACSITTDMGNASGITSDMHGINIQHTVDDVTTNAFGINGQVQGTGHSSSPGTANFHALHFAATISGSVDVGGAEGVDAEATWNGDPGTTLANGTGMKATVNAGVLGGDMDEAIAANFVLNLIGGTVTNAWGINVNTVTNTATVGTLYGINLGDMTDAGATTTWAIYSQGGDSSHLGDFRFGSNSAPSAKVHMDAGSTSAGSAPAKYTAGSLMSAVEAGAREYDGSYHYLTNSTTRGAIASTGNVVVDMGGDVVTTLDGEVLLAA